MRPSLSFLAGGSKDRERPHQPEGGWAGRVRGPVQDQETHPAEQADEGLLREAGVSSLPRPGAWRFALQSEPRPLESLESRLFRVPLSWRRVCARVSVGACVCACERCPWGCFLSAPVISWSPCQLSSPGILLFSLGRQATGPTCSLEVALRVCRMQPCGSFRCRGHTQVKTLPAVPWFPENP